MKKTLVTLAAFLIGLSLVLTGLVLMTGGAEAQSAVLCGKRDAVVEALHRNHGEVAVSRGLTSRGTLIEVFASPKSDSFTIINSRPDGISCLVAAGEGWQAIKRPPLLSAY